MSKPKRNIEHKKNHEVLKSFYFDGGDMFNSVSILRLYENYIIDKTTAISLFEINSTNKELTTELIKSYENNNKNNI